MEKPAETQYPIHELLARRWSPRAFAPRPVEPEKLRSLFEAARWAASCFNEQPWDFLVATRDDPADYERMLHCLVEFNQGWAQSAPVLMISVAKLQFAKNGKENRHALHDVGQAAQNLALQATALGLFVHQMAGFSLEKARETFSIPETHVPAAAWALGYAPEPAQLDDETRAREAAPRERKPVASFVFKGKFGEKSPLV